MVLCVKRNCRPKNPQKSISGWMLCQIKSFAINLWVSLIKQFFKNTFCSCLFSSVWKSALNLSISQSFFLHFMNLSTAQSSMFLLIKYFKKCSCFGVIIFICVVIFNNIITPLTERLFSGGFLILDINKCYSIVTDK